MKLTQILKKREPHIGKLLYVLFATSILNAIAHFATDGASKVRSESVIFLVGYTVFVIVWPFSVIVRLHELRLSLLWILPILVPPLVLALSLREDWGWVWMPMVAFVAALAVQVPLVWLSPPKELAAVGNAQPDRPLP